MPDLYEGLNRIDEHYGKQDYPEVLRDVYSRLKAVSIDYGIMEKVSNVYLIKGNFSWSDLGSWEQVYKLSNKDGDGNATTGDTVMIDTQNCLVHVSDGLVAAIGIEDAAIIKDGDTVLICRIDQAEQVKQVVEYLKKKKMQDFL